MIIAEGLQRLGRGYCSLLTRLDAGNGALRADFGVFSRKMEFSDAKARRKRCRIGNRDVRTCLPTKGG
jgi:hypothetical protein